MDRSTRRTFLAGVSGGVALLAGCVDGNQSGPGDAPRSASGGDDGTTANTDTPSGERETVSEPTQETPTGDTELTVPEPVQSDPQDLSLSVREPVVPLSYDIGNLQSDALNGGVPKDGIPSIDSPSHGDVAAGDDFLDPGDPVFGVVVDGQARAYPQRILVYHEIVNDRINDKGVAVTYCPLTGTALGFERGDVEFGVSGMLVNSNLIMYDRETDTWWPQMAGMGVKGDLKGWALDEFRVTWTTWERWKSVHPDTEILVEDTGHARNYGSDPYGSYNPKGRYYVSSNLYFEPRYESDQFHEKEIFIGARGSDGAVAFMKESLRESLLMEATVDGVPYLAAYHEALDSAWVYSNPDGKSFSATDGGYEGPDGTVYGADELPLESINAFDTFWFPWYGFFPETTVVA